MWLYFISLLVFVWLVDWVRRIPWLSGIHQKCVVITGCDSGFGNALARSLYSKGVYVFAGCFTDEGARKLTQETGKRLKTFKLDIGKTESIEQAFIYVKQELPKNAVLWGLVNNAGTIGYPGPCEVITRDDMLEVMNVNCMGPVEMVRVFLPLLKQSRGRIVNTASVAGVVAGPGLLPYTVSKFAVVGYSEALRHEKAVWGISVSTVLPGTFTTPITKSQTIKSIMDRKWDSLDSGVKEELGRDYYDKIFHRLCGNMDKLANPDLSPVVDAYEHALFARCPRSAYYPGTDSYILVTLQRWLPWMMGYIFKNVWKGALPKALQDRQ